MRYRLCYSLGTVSGVLHESDDQAQCVRVLVEEIYPFWRRESRLSVRLEDTATRTFYAYPAPR